VHYLDGYQLIQTIVVFLSDSNCLEILDQYKFLDVPKLASINPYQGILLYILHFSPLVLKEVVYMKSYIYSQLFLQNSVQLLSKMLLSK